ncbi:MAG: hypothetical protein FD147_248 [Chloroflexi bacterium]|nr:MAG: hypothetical protein FD147_248 [Chloroflexota bacterium]
MEITQFNEFPVELKEEWNKLLENGISHVPFLRFEYLRDWWQTRGGGEWPLDAQLAILVARNDGEVIGIAPFFVSYHQGIKRLLLLGSIEISDYLDLIVSEQNAAAFINSIVTYIKEQIIPETGLSVIDLYNLVEGSPSVSILTAAGIASGFEVTEARLQQSPYITLPGDWEQYLNSLDKKQRHEIRRKMRRAAESEIPVQMYLASEAAKLDEDIDAFLALMARDPEKARFLTQPMRTQFRQTIHCAFSAGCLQLAFLTIGGEKAAAYLNFDYLNRVWVYNSGLDRRFMDFSPGWVLLGHLLQWANVNRRAEFDFMRGDEDYKYKFGAVDRFVVRVTLTN